MKLRSALIGLVVFYLMIVVVGYCEKCPKVEEPPEPPFDCYSITHFLFGITVFLLVTFGFSLPFRACIYLSRINKIDLIVTSSILIGWEAFELAGTPNYWLSSIVNNFLDVVVGLFGAFIGIKIEKIARALLD